MITAENEFTPVPCFTHIAGCSLGTWSQREIALAILEAIEAVSPTLPIEWWRDLARTSDDHISACIEELEQELASLDVVPEYCYIGWQDSELMVLPLVDVAISDAQEELIGSGDELPEYNPDNWSHYLVTNDHGNATLYHWQHYPRKWEETWSVV